MVHIFLITTGIGWAAGVAVGLQRLGRFEGTAGAEQRAGEMWPTEAPRRNETGYTLAVFLHPACPCSTATVSTLDKIMARSGGKVRTYVYVIMPDGAPAAWRTGGLVE